MAFNFALSILEGRTQTERLPVFRVFVHPPGEDPLWSGVCIGEYMSHHFTLMECERLFPWIRSRFIPYREDADADPES